MIFKDPPSSIIDSTFPTVKVDIDRYIESNGIENFIKLPNMLPMKFCLLTTKGSISNEWKRIAIFYIEYDGSIYIAASWGGNPVNPAWYNNMLKNPIVWIQRESKEYWAISKEIDEIDDSELRELIWKKLCAVFPMYDEFQKRCPNRTIPVIKITRI